MSVSAIATAIVTDVSVGVILLAICFWAYCLFDFSRTDEFEMRTYSRQVWMLILIFTSIFGSLMWIVYGRPQRPSRG